jgi:ankyrin repeat protein
LIQNTLLSSCLLLASQQEGNTALLGAIAYRQVAIVELLFQAGADVEAKNKVNYPYIMQIFERFDDGNAIFSLIPYWCTLYYLISLAMSFSRAKPGL